PFGKPDIPIRSGDNRTAVECFVRKQIAHQEFMDLHRRRYLSDVWAIVLRKPYVAVRAGHDPLRVCDIRRFGDLARYGNPSYLAWPRRARTFREPEIVVRAFPNLPSRIGGRTEWP